MKRRMVDAVKKINKGSETADAENTGKIDYKRRVVAIRRLSSYLLNLPTI